MPVLDASFLRFWSAFSAFSSWWDGVCRHQISSAVIFFLIAYTWSIRVSRSILGVRASMREHSLGRGSWPIM